MIPLLRVSHLVPVITGMREIGAPVDRMLRAAKLPTLVHDEPSRVVPEAFVWKLCALVSEREGIADFGFRIAETTPVWRSEPALFAALADQLTVWTALQRFCELARLVSTGPGYRIDRVGGQMVLRHMNWQGAEGQEQVDLYTLLLMTQTVERIVGRSWRPAEIIVGPSNERHVTRYEQFSHSRVRYGVAYTGVVVPDELLAEPVRIPLPTADVPALHVPIGDDDVLAPIRAALSTYLVDARPRVGLAAEIAGLSERTFQRRLADAGLNYSQLLDQVRFEEARAALARSDRPITAIAFDLGFTDASHFTRAFRRWTSMSPRQYRKLAPATRGGSVDSRAA